MEGIRQFFADKNFDEKSLQLISNFIKEFDDLFGKYVPRDELIKRIKDNLDDIVFEHEFEKKSIKGGYTLEERKIYLAENDEENLMGTFFHEMIHCITAQRETGTSGFSKKLYSEDLTNVEFITCHGLTEGFTEYVTQQRTQKYAPDLKRTSYPILAEQVGNIAELIGEDTFLDIGFNRPDNINQELELEDEYGIVDDDFYDAFDVIWQEEKEIYQKRPSNLSNEEKLFMGIFGIKPKIQESKHLKFAKMIIIDKLKEISQKKPITNVEQFNREYWRICAYAEQLGTEIELHFFDSLLEQLNNLQQSGKKMDEILEEIPYDLRALIKGNKVVKKFYQSSQKVELLTQKSFLEQLEKTGILDSQFCEKFLAQMAGSIIQTDSKERNLALFNQLIMGLAQIIKDRGYNINTLAIEYIDFKNSSIFDLINNTMLFNLYDTNTEKCTYLSTFCYSDDEDEIQEFTPHLVDKEKIIEEYPNLKNATILSTKLGEILAYKGDNEYIFINGEGRICISKEITYCPSRIDVLQQKLNKRIAQLQRLTQLRAPDAIVNRQKELVEIVLLEIKQIQSQSEILPEEIEAVTGDITQEEIEAIMENMTTSKEKRQEALERGIGYGE